LPLDLYLEIEINQIYSRCMSLEPSDFRSPEEYLTNRAPEFIYNDEKFAL
jgi:hypothetical protein